VDNLIGIREASKLLGLAVPTLYKLIARRDIPFIKLTARVQFDPARLQEWVREHEHAPIGSSRSRP